MTYRRIVVGTDGSQTAALAVRAAGELAGASGARLVVVTAFERNPDVETARQSEVPDDLRWAASDRHQAEALAKRGRTIAREAGASDVVISTDVGAPAEVVLTAAEEHGADLIVVGSKGMTDASRFVLGSVADRVSHHAPCDVLIVHTTG